MNPTPSIQDVDVKRALQASKIKWKTVNDWRQRLNYNSNEEMLLDWMHDRDAVFRRGLFKRPNPFHKHVRNYLDIMEHLGLTSLDMVIDQGLELTKEQLEQLKETKEDFDDD